MQIAKMFRRALPVWIGLTLTMGAYATPASGKEILSDLRRFRETGRVLFIAAHPDDENTWLLAYLARGRHYATGYLSLTRGDGGQNLIGSEFGDQLGVIRTQELLAARRIDGAVQFFSRARDFGFSKDYQQTLTRWDRKQVLEDMVRVIRQFHPDVLITRFSPLPSTTHGHHTASAVLAIEAFKLAGDPNFLPDVPVWQPRRILYNQGGPGGVTGNEGLRLDVSGTDEVTGKTYGAVASESRSQHVSQGFGAFANHDAARVETFQLLAGEPAKGDIMDGVEPRMTDIAPVADKALADFDPAHPEKSLPILLTLRNHMNALRGDPIVAEKYALLDKIILECAGVEVKSTVAKAEVASGEKVKIEQTVTLASQTPVLWKNAGIELKREQSARHTEEVSVTGPPTQPYWLSEEGTPGMFSVTDARLIGRPENPPLATTTDYFGIGGQMIAVHSQPRDAVGRPLEIVSPVSLHFASQAQLFTPGSSHEVHVNADLGGPYAGPPKPPANVHGKAQGSVRLEVPAGWTSLPAQQDLVGENHDYVFTVTAPQKLETVTLQAVARVGGVDYSNDRIDIQYPHIPPLLLQPPARLKAVTLNLAIRGKTVGYLPGAGDSTVNSLQQMGYTVKTLSGADLASPETQKLDAIVVGVRAFNVRKDLRPADLFRYVEHGGNVVVQYNTPRGLENKELAPYKLELSDNLPKNRVTDENSQVTILDPKHPALNVPNKIGPADFQGWVQERGLNFPAQWDRAHFTALLACSDAGEAPLQSGLLVAHYGKGYFVYTGLSFFRQLPAGVPGAYRLFANLVSLGK